MNSCGGHATRHCRCYAAGASVRIRRPPMTVRHRTAKLSLCGDASVIKDHKSQKSFIDSRGLHDCSPVFGRQLLVIVNVWASHDYLEPAAHVIAVARSPGRSRSSCAWAAIDPGRYDLPPEIVASNRHVTCTLHVWYRFMMV